MKVHLISFIATRMSSTFSAVPILILLLGVATLGRAANQPNEILWKSIDARSLPPATKRLIVPKTYRLIRLSKAALLQTLVKAPMEFTRDATENAAIISLPMPDGKLARFRFEESPVMAPALASRHPEIKTYSAQGLDDPTATARFDWTPFGLNAIIFSDQGTSFVEPVSSGDISLYVSYSSRDLSTDRLSLSCLLSDEEIADARRRGVSLNQSAVAPAFVTGSLLRTYNLAVAATAEFTQQYGGGDVNLTLAKITTLINQVTAVYRKEATISFQLVPNETSIIFTDPDDGYTNESPSAMLAENQSKLDAVIGSDNYDIGHVFGSISECSGSACFSGIASLGVGCNDGMKARGVSTMGGANSSFPDNIFVIGVTHEIGHQFSAPHSFNSTTAGCAGQRSSTGAYEPGSGSTIMGYSICGSDNLQPLPDLYFHTGSLEQIVTYAAGAGDCALRTTTGNNAPVIPSLSNFTIPANTPFTLTASVTDLNGDPLTCNWEEFDLGAASPPNDDDGTRPIFRSFIPSSSTSRTFPQLQYILHDANVPPASYACGSGTCLTGELLPSTTRTVNFRFTARDNQAAGGGASNASMQVSVVSTAGPFAITAPNTGITVQALSNLNVAWNVAGTTAPPINAANVKISLSVDGGNTFPALLSSSTANDGSEAVMIPNVSTNMARIKVEAVDNVFFDISDANFTIIPVPATFSVVALTGQHAPGTETGVTYSSFNSDFPPRLNVTGACAFHAQLTGPSVDTNNNQGIWSGAPGGVVLVARTGSQNFSNFIFGKSAINGAGKSAFWAGVPGGSIWLGGPGNVRLLARVGDQVPGQDPGVYYINLEIQDIFPPTLNGAGQTAFQAQIHSDHSYGLWVGTPDGIVVLARVGDQAPGTPPETTYYSLGSWDPINAAGQSMFAAQLVCSGPSDCGVREENNVGLWLGAPGSVALLARKGDPAPGTGADYQHLGHSTINAAGQTTFPGNVGGPGVTDENDDCLWFGAPGRVTLLAREGEPAPGTPPGVSYGQFVITPSLNSTGRTAFIAPISGPGFPGATGVWLGAPGSVRKIFYQGEPAPSAGEGTLFGPPIINGGSCCDAIHGAVGLNDRAEIVFLTQLTGPSITPANDGSLWFSDVGGGLSLIVREGDLIQVGPDDARVVSDVFFLGGSGDEDGLPSGFNDLSQVAFMARFTDGSEGIFIAAPGTAAPTPTPSPGPNTPPGNNVPVQSPSGGENVVFAQVTAGGFTAFISIDPASAGQLPSGYELSAQSRAFDITTSATVVGPIDVSFHFPAIINPTVFATLRILHGESGILVDRTLQHDFATKMVRARVDSLSPFVVAQSTAAPNRLLNISTRLRVETGDNVLIGGLIITGNDPKRVIVRGIGPTLNGVPDALQNPTLQLFQAGIAIAENDNWKDTQQAEIEATGIPPTDDLESAIVRTLSPGAYTAILRGKDDGTGIGLVEAYDLSAAADATLANISTRGFVSTGDNVLIGGFIVGSTSNTPAAVVVRAIGPSLSGLGVPGALQDPTLDLHNASGTVVASNDNWRETQQVEINASGIPPSDDRESAIVATLASGAYTAIVSGTDNATGVAVVEVYNVQ